MKQTVENYKQQLNDIEKRSVEIQTEITKTEITDERLDALKSEMLELSNKDRQLRDKIEILETRNKIAEDEGLPIISRGPVIKNVENEKALHKRAFLKNLMGKQLDKEERSVLTTDSSSGGVLIPSELSTKIWDLVSGRHSLLADVPHYQTNGVMEFLVHKAIKSGAAKKVDENTANDDEENEFEKVTLTGADYSKHFVMSYAMENMSINSFENYITTEIATELGRAITEDLFQNIHSKIPATTGLIMPPVNKAGDLQLYPGLVSALAAADRADNLTIYVNRKTFYKFIVGMQDTTGRPIYQNSLSDGVNHYLFGYPVKFESAIPDLIILFLDPSGVVFNVNAPVQIERFRDIKKHNITISGYCRCEGALLDPLKASILMTMNTTNT